MAPCRSPLAAAGRVLAAGDGALAAEGAVIAEAGLDLEALRGEVSRLEAQLRDEFRPQLALAAAAAAALRTRVGELGRSLQALSASREEATEQVGRLTKRQLSEIKQLTRSPPESVRRTLSASWLILHSERFRGQTTVSFDDAKDWPRCQRMLVDEAFITRIQAFDPSCLDEVPSVPLHVASSYLGMLPAGGPAEANERGAPARKSERSESPAQRRPARTSLARPSGRASGVARPPLEVEAVARASEPCGSLLRWLRELVTEHVERTKLLKELAALELELAAGERREAHLECDAAEAEAALSRARSTLAERERAHERLLREQSVAQRASRDVARLDALRLGKETPPRAASAPSPEPKPKPRPKPKAPPPPQLELEVSGTLAVVEQELARLTIKFDHGLAGVLEGDPEHALMLPKIADILKDHRGKLKLLIEGHCKSGEPDGLDIERSLAVYQWLVEVAGCAPGFLRIKGRGTTYGMGQCAVPVPIQELVVRRGPVQGLLFAEAGAELAAEGRQVLAEMAKCILSDDYTVRIEGHADAGEQPEVALKRACGVRDALLDLGVGRSQLRVESCKAHHPLSRLQAAVNRRVEIHVD